MRLHVSPCVSCYFPARGEVSFEFLAFMFFAFCRFFTGGLGTIFVTVERLWCHSWCLSRSSQALLASFIPVWLPQEGFKRQSFLTRRTLTRHAQACTDRTSRPTSNSTETGPTSRGLPKTQKLHRERTQRAPGDTHKGVRGGPGNPREHERPPGSRIVAPCRCPSAPKHTL